jgi:hypothetical protein
MVQTHQSVAHTALICCSNAKVSEHVKFYIHLFMRQSLVLKDNLCLTLLPVQVCTVTLTDGLCGK